MDHWITTHWPVLESDRNFARHVYVKDRHVKVPVAGDQVFVRESQTVKGKLSPTVERHDHGVVQPIKVPEGYGGIIGSMTVTGTHRPIKADDLVYDYGDLREWSIIECANFRPTRLSLDRLMTALGYAPGTTPRFLDLWLVPEKRVRSLLAAIGR